MVQPNPFTPKSGTEPRVFFDRREEIDFFAQRVEDSKGLALNNYVITGEWGIGKTALLKYLKVVCQEANCLGAYFTAQEFRSDADDKELVIHLLQSLTRSLPVELSKGSSLIKSLQGFGVQVLGTGFNIALNLERNIVVDPQIMLLDGLLSMWRDVARSCDAIAVLIDDIQNFREVPRILTTLKNVLSTDEITKETKFLFVLSSTVEGWRQFMERSHPVGRFFIPRRDLRRFTREETVEFIKATLAGMGVEFSSSVLSAVWDYTRGHLFEIHALCAALYDSLKNGKVTMREWNRAMRDGLLYLGDAIFDSQLSQASAHESGTIHILSFFDEPTPLGEITKLAKKLKMHDTGLNERLRRLVVKGIIQRPERAHYFIEDRLFREYVKGTLASQLNRQAP